MVSPYQQSLETLLYVVVMNVRMKESRTQFSSKSIRTSYYSHFTTSNGFNTIGIEQQGEHLRIYHSNTSASTHYLSTDTVIPVNDFNSTDCRCSSPQNGVQYRELMNLDGQLEENHPQLPRFEELSVVMVLIKGNAHPVIRIRDLQSFSLFTSRRNG